MTEETTARTIENLYSEERTFSPPEKFVAQANLSDPEIYDRAARLPRNTHRHRIAACNL